MTSSTVVGTLTVFLTAFYTFRMVFIVFGNRAGRDKPVRETSHKPLKTLPRIMETCLLPLALLGLAGGLFNMPGYLGSGLLDSFLAPLNAHGGHPAQATELAMQGGAALVSLSGLAFAWWYYGGARRNLCIVRAEQPSSGMTAFLQTGWHFDDLYSFLFVRPYKWLATVFWERVDEEGIDDSLNQAAVRLGRTGQFLGRWGSGRVSVYMLSLACGATLMIGWFAWVVL